METITPDTMGVTLNLNDVVLLDVFAYWCSPCSRMMPLIEDIARDYIESASIVKMELDTNKEFLQSELHIQKVPTFIFYKNGQEHTRFEGVTRMQVLRDTLDELIYETSQTDKGDIYDNKIG